MLHRSEFIWMDGRKLDRLYLYNIMNDEPFNFIQASNYYIPTQSCFRTHNSTSCLMPGSNNRLGHRQNSL